MDIAKGVCVKLKQILCKLKMLKIIRSFTYKVDFEKVNESDRECLLQIDDLLGKCIQKICWKPRRAEIRNVIGELMRKKNLEQNLLDDYERENSIAVKKVKPKKEAKNRRNLKSLKSSLLANLDEEMYLCEFCGDRFDQYSRMINHILRIHNKREDFALNEEFDSTHLKDKPETKLNVELENNYKCNLCWEALDFPQRLHVRGEPCPYQKRSSPAGLHDDLAHKTPEGQNMLQSKERTSNDDTKTETCTSYVCSYCSKMFRLERSLRKHIRLKHNREAHNNFPCNRCNKTFAEKGKLNRHLLTHKQGQFQCSQCSRSFHRMDNLKRHCAQVHQQLKSFECRHCQKGFSLKFNRDIHERNVHEVGAGIECELCGKKCKNKTTFNEHKKIHEKNPFSCTLCSKKFIRKVQYRNHLKNKHKGISPFQKLFDSVAKTASDSPP